MTQPAKRKDTQIYIIGHKDLTYGYWSNTLYTPIEAGAVMREDTTFAELKDDKFKDNVSEWNTFLNETSATYWLWKHAPKSIKWIGICQYRRRLEFNEDIDFNAFIGDKKIIMPKPLELGGTVENQYSKCHCKKDMEMFQMAIKELYPDYLDDFNRVINNGHTLYYSAGMIARREDFDAYCEFLFSILDHVKAQMDVKTPYQAMKYAKLGIESGERSSVNGLVYQKAIGGFLQERIMTLWVLHNFDRKEILHVNYKKMESGI